MGERVRPGVCDLEPDEHEADIDAEVEKPEKSFSQETLAKQSGGILTFPYHIISGVAGRFADLYSHYLESPKEFFYLSFLTCLGSIVCERLTLKSELRTQPRLYTVLLGESANTRKSKAAELTINFFETIDFFEAAVSEFATCYGVGSAEGLEKKLKKSPSLLLFFDEFKAFISKAKIETSVLLPCVATLFEGNNYENLTSKSKISLRGVYLSILGACTTQTWETMWTGQFLDIGLINRIFIVPGKGEKKFPVPLKIPESEKAALLTDVKKCLELVGGNLEMEFTQEANEYYKPWYLGLEKSIHAQRLDNYALRFMLLLSISEFKTKIDLEIVHKVTELMDWQLQVRKFYDPIDADNMIARMEESIRKQLKAHGEMKVRDLMRVVHYERSGLWAWEKAINNLQKHGEITWDDDQKGKPVWRWLYPDDENR